MKIKNLLAGMVLLGTSTFAGNIWAADWGPCQTENGQPYEYSFDFIQTISVPSENKAGTNLTSGYALTGTYQAGCECPDPIPNSIMTYFKGVSLLPEPGATKGYFKFNNNIDVLPAIYVLSHADLSVPFTDKGNRAPGKECLSNIESTTWTTGSKGNIKIAISHPFVGQLSIPRTPVAALYATKKNGGI
ncbi:hypothetical protein [Escherichia sp. E4385]|uniref:hypothetical protein n=1 Tax=Escherichia sp. E4385 TaxID=2040639 RepID=UPI001F0FC390|nr:hypothetical protein [Escherichia sp. E4385]